MDFLINNKETLVIFFLFGLSIWYGYFSRNDFKKMLEQQQKLREQLSNKIGDIVNRREAKHELQRDSDDEHYKGLKRVENFYYEKIEKVQKDFNSKKINKITQGVTFICVLMFIVIIIMLYK